MSVLDTMNPQRVMHYFAEICAIPHGSGNTQALSNYCAAFGRSHGLEVYQDEAGNVVLIKAASPGYEDVPAVIVQGHLDMVCDREPGCDLDMTREGLRLRTDGAYVWAEGTTLGGDDGIAVAMALAALEAEDLPHPRLEVVLTTGEEIGMLGAVALEPSMLQGRMMLNIDSEVEGVFTVSCAGGVRATSHVPVAYETVNGVFCGVIIKGLIGGHSGVEIHKGRANANLLMGRVLSALTAELPVHLAAIVGGQADNAIANECVATMVLREADLERAAAIVAALGETFRREYQTADPGLTVEWRQDPRAEDHEAVTTAESARRVADALLLLPHGIQTWSIDIPGLVQTSLNLGVARMAAGELTATFAVRSSLASEKKWVCDRIEHLTALLGGHVSYVGDYPAWEYQKDSPLRDLVTDVYRRQYGQEPVIEAIHAGLECGVFAGKLPGLQCISFGPNLLEIHTVREKMDVASVQRTWTMLQEILRRTKELKR